MFNRIATKRNVSLAAFTFAVAIGTGCITPDSQTEVTGELSVALEAEGWTTHIFDRWDNQGLEILVLAPNTNEYSSKNWKVTFSLGEDNYLLGYKWSPLFERPAYRATIPAADVPLAAKYLMLATPSSPKLGEPFMEEGVHKPGSGTPINCQLPPGDDEKKEEAQETPAANKSVVPWPPKKAYRPFTDWEEKKYPGIMKGGCGRYSAAVCLALLGERDMDEKMDEEEWKKYGDYANPDKPSGSDMEKMSEWFKKNYKLCEEKFSWPRFSMSSPAASSERMKKTAKKLADALSQKTKDGHQKCDCKMVFERWDPNKEGGPGVSAHIETITGVEGTEVELASWGKSVKMTPGLSTHPKFKLYDEHTDIEVYCWCPCD